MKIAIVTANIGGFDPVLGMVKQKSSWHKIDYLYYDETNLPFPLPNLNNRLKSRYIKIQMHRFLQEYDAYIWIDGRIKIISNTFVEYMFEQLKDVDVAIYKHRERNSIYDEMGYIIKCMKQGNEYLLSRYANQSMLEEAKFYKKEKVPKDFPLYSCYVFARWNNEESNKCFDEWWRRCIEFSYFDQTMFSYSVFKTNIKVNSMEFDEIRTPKLFRIGSHI